MNFVIQAACSARRSCVGALPLCDCSRRSCCGSGRTSFSTYPTISNPDGISVALARLAAACLRKEPAPGHIFDRSHPLTLVPSLPPGRRRPCRDLATTAQPTVVELRRRNAIARASALMAARRTPPNLNSRRMRGCRRGRIQTLWRDIALCQSSIRPFEKMDTATTSLESSPTMKMSAGFLCAQSSHRQSHR